jgi:hypothetical protein
MLGWSASRCRSWIGNASPLSVLGRSSVDASEQLPSSCFFSEHLPTLWAYDHTRYTACQGSICQARPLLISPILLQAHSLGSLSRPCILAFCSNRKKNYRVHSGRSKPTGWHRAAACQRSRRDALPTGAGKSKSRIDQEGRSKNWQS